ncbi:MAG TPA: LysR family transcriptional regulator, partial [Lachnospiraceae bacterium]|nr:LysR family transcriptional regulator [Lachnospiraceae bacterium]
MTLQQLKYVVMVAEKGTISEAAKELFISQPSLTSAVKELERELQITIFTRTNKGIVVSNEGNIFLGYARQVLEQANLLEERYLGEKRIKPMFSVSTQHYSFAVNAFVDLIKEY